MAKATKDFAEAIRRKLARDDELARKVEKELLNINVSEEVYRARIESGLTQKQLADKVGTQQSVIARLEDADYDGHSVKLLRRIADVTGRRLEVRFVDSVTTKTAQQNSVRRNPAAVSKR